MTRNQVAGLFIETHHVISAANGDWILEAYDGNEQTNEEFLLACIALILKEPDAKLRLIRFFRVMADRMEAQDGK